jgi:hypothetical protein
LLLARHVTKEEDQLAGSDQPKECIFGGFAPTEWYEELAYHGESDSYVFSLYPTFKTFTSYKGEGGTKYRYMNTKKIQNSKFKVGLGISEANNVKENRFWRQ